MKLEDYKNELSETVKLLKHFNDTINELRELKNQGFVTIDDALDALKLYRYRVSNRAEKLHSEFHNFVK